MGNIFDGIEVLPIDQIVGESVSNLRSRGKGGNKGGDRDGGSQDPVVEQLDKIIGHCPELRYLI